MIKLKVSYMSEHELAAFLRHMARKYPDMKWKRPKNAKGRYKKGYLLLEEVKKC